MTVVLDISPEKEAVWQAKAQARGLTVQEWLLRLADQSGPASIDPGASGADARTIGEIILDNMKDVPRAEFARLPKDGASEHDHYLYGHPKREQ